MTCHQRGHSHPFSFPRYAQLHLSSRYATCDQPVGVWTLFICRPGVKRCAPFPGDTAPHGPNRRFDSPCATRSELDGLSSRAPWEKICVWLQELRCAPTSSHADATLFCDLLHQIDVTGSTAVLSTAETRLLT